MAMKNLSARARIRPAFLKHHDWHTAFELAFVNGNLEILNHFITKKNSTSFIFH